MTLLEQIEMWNILNPDIVFWDYEINPIVDKSALQEYLLYEYGEMETIDALCGQLRGHIRNFFSIHKWNIDKLASTLELEYDPLLDEKWNENYHRSDDKTTDLSSERDITDDASTVDTVTASEKRNWDDTSHTDETNTNLVSAFNMPLATLKDPQDSEHHRDVLDSTTDRSGNNQIDRSSNETIKYDNKTDDDLKSKQVIDDDEWKDINHSGLNNHTYQSLIEEERKQAQFNIYKWIGRHFSEELLLCIW